MKYNFINKRKPIPKIIILVLAIIMFIPTGCAISNRSFNDISGHWAEETIREWIENQMIIGYPGGSFKPDKPITRAEFAALTNRALSFNSIGNINFKDVRPSDWFYNDIQIAANNYMPRFPDNTFRPTNRISREEAAVIIAGINNLQDDVEGAKKFKDYDKISDQVKARVGAVVTAKLMQGNPDNKFMPEKLLTRAEAVIVLQNLIASGDNEPILVTEVKLDRVTAEVIEGETVKLFALIEPTNATNKAVEWLSSDSSVATVDNNGLVSAIKAGTVTITVTTIDGAKTDFCIVTVNKKPPTVATNIKIIANVRDAESTTPTDKGGYLIELELNDGTKMQELSMLEVKLYKDSVNLVTNTLAFDRINDKTKKSSAITCPFNLGTVGNSLWSWDRGAFPVPNPLDNSVIPNKVIVNFTKNNIDYTFTKELSLRLPVVQNLPENNGK